MEPAKALAQASLVVAMSPAGAVAPRLVAKPAQRVSARRAFSLGAVWAAIPLVADTAPDFHGVPGLTVYPASQLSEHFLGQALATAVAVLR